MATGVWTGLSPAQADGLACVVCTRSLHAGGTVTVPVGRSPTGSPVFACAGHCAQQASAAPVLATHCAQVAAVPVEAITAAGAAFLDVLAQAGGDVHGVSPDELDELVSATVHAAAPIVVAAELRQIAAEQQLLVAKHGDTAPRARQWCPVCLRSRADELDPGGGCTGEHRDAYPGSPAESLTTTYGRVAARARQFACDAWLTGVPQLVSTRGPGFGG